jgi:polysaccharide deacetylase 2 family uncharacterized protein YibQ
MPKAKAKPITKKSAPKRSKAKKIKRRRPRLGLYLLAGLGTVLIMWALIREPLPAPRDLEKLVVQETRERVARPAKPAKEAKSKEAEKPKREPKRRSEPEQTEPVQAPAVAKIEPEKPIPVETPKPKAGETDLDLVIRNAAEKLGVPQSAARRRKQDNLVRYSVPIDRAQMDLTYANMIFKGEMERAGATMHKGTDTRNKQTLSFRHKNIPENYELDLYYDSSIYKSVQNTKTITIVVDDFGGISGKLLDGFFELDKEVTFAVFPDEAHSVSTMQRATLQGRDTIIHVPMEPIGYPRINPGKNAILVQHTEDRIDKMLSQFINKMPDCIGINNHMGSLATNDSDVMQAVMNTLKRHDKLFLDSRTTNVSVAYQTAQKTHLRAFRNDIFLDSPNISQSNMEAKINQIIRLSESRRHVIAITHCHNQDKLDYLKSFIQRLKKAGYILIPLSEIGERDIPEIL